MLIYVNENSLFFVWFLLSFILAIEVIVDKIISFLYFLLEKLISQFLIYLLTKISILHCTLPELFIIKLIVLLTYLFNN